MKKTSVGAFLVLVVAVLAVGGNGNSSPITPSRSLILSPSGQTTASPSSSVSPSDPTAAVSPVRTAGAGTKFTLTVSPSNRAEAARNVTGGGLGLYFSNGIVSAHGGRMWAESPGHGQGSTFCFTLPLRKKHSADRPVEDRA